MKVTTHDTIRTTSSSRAGLRHALRGRRPRRASRGFSIGSFAAAINPLNPNDATGGLLNALLGDALNTGVLGYSGLATANLTYLRHRQRARARHAQRAVHRRTSAPTTPCDAQAEILRRNSANAAQLAVLDPSLAVPNSPLTNVRSARSPTCRPAARTPPSARRSTSSTSSRAARSSPTAPRASRIPATLLGIPGLTGNIGLNLIQSPQTAFGPLGTWAQHQPGRPHGVSIPHRLDHGLRQHAVADEPRSPACSARSTGVLNLAPGAPLRRPQPTRRPSTRRPTSAIHLAKATGTIDTSAAPPGQRAARRRGAAPASWPPT